MNRLTPLLALALLPGLAPAQAVGDAFPEVKVDAQFNLKPFEIEKLTDLKGPALLVEFWATWCGPCRAQIPHMNEVQEKYRERGLLVVGITDEPPEKVEPFLESQKVAHPIVVESGKGTMRALGVRGIPTAFLLDPSGKIVWTGHPARLTDDIIESALEGAVPPFSRLEGALAPVQGLLDKGRKGKALEILRSMMGGALGEADNRVAGFVLAGLEHELEQLRTEAGEAVKRQDWYGAGRALGVLVRQFEGNAAATEAAAKRAELGSTPEVEKELRGAEAVLEAEALAKGRQYDRAFEAYGAIAEGFAGTAAATVAREAMRGLEEGGLRGYRDDCAACREAGKACQEHAR